jgi:hypothetical protein
LTDVVPVEEDVVVVEVDAIEVTPVDEMPVDAEEGNSPEDLKRP